MIHNFIHLFVTTFISLVEGEFVSSSRDWQSIQHHASVVIPRLPLALRTLHHAVGQAWLQASDASGGQNSPSCALWVRRGRCSKAESKVMDAL